jgi:hypothetical protein
MKPGAEIPLLPDLVITEVKNVNVSDYKVTIQNKGQGDATKLFYVCMWDEVYAAKGKGTTCNSGKIANLNESTSEPISLKPGSTQTVTFEGVMGLPAHEKIYFVVDKSDNPSTDNSITESDETNNTYVYSK